MSNIDSYTKAVLTVIALALVTLVFRISRGPCRLAPQTKFILQAIRGTGRLIIRRIIEESRSEPLLAQILGCL